MKLLYFLAGLVLGWWVKPERAEPCQEQEEVNTKDEYYEGLGLESITRSIYAIGEDDLADTPKTWKSEDGWVFDGTGFGMKILGVYDRVLTNEELKRIHGMSVDEVEDSFEDTQPIRLSSQRRENDSCYAMDKYDLPYMEKNRISSQKEEK